jgi:flagellar basal-body rod protein FlgF
MIRGLYGAATALDAATARQEATAENLAHLSTPGYRAHGVIFEPFEQELGRARGSGNSGGVKNAGTYVDFQPGAIRQTGSPYNLAIDGDSFFALEGPHGTVYTRNGSFRLGTDGQLQSEAGYPVLGTNGPISIPPDSRNMMVSRDGNISADGAAIDQLKLTKFENTGKLQQVGPTLFEAPNEAGATEGTSSVLQGSLEGSNVNPATAMVEMIQAARYFEAAQRALRAVADALQMNTRSN